MGFRGPPPPGCFQSARGPRFAWISIGVSHWGRLCIFGSGLGDAALDESGRIFAFTFYLAWRTARDEIVFSFGDRRN